MKAPGCSERGPVSAPNSVVEFDADMPGPGVRDPRVEVRGGSVNPVDAKIRANRPPEGTPILGFDHLRLRPKQMQALEIAHVTPSPPRRCRLWSPHRQVPKR